ncbi:MAG: arginine--tRNA ligase [Spirochaetia bacterium]|nr:arginine--tRNA ligase [Spirochaetia bacterium]
MQAIKAEIIGHLEKVFIEISKDYQTEIPSDYKIRLEYPPEYKFGDYSTPLAMESARYLKRNPREIAENIIKELLKNEDFNEIVKGIKPEGPGFINFFLSEEYALKKMKEAISVQRWINEMFPYKEEPSYIFEFVSANPTGPLNIVSARAAAVGDSICRLLGACGKKVHKEYYVNDYGNQIKLLGISLAYRFAQKNDIEVVLPEDCYQGEYLIKIIEAIVEIEILPDYIENIPLCDDKQGFEKWAEKAGDFFSELAVNAILETHKSDLKDFRVEYDEFFSEKKLHGNGSVDRAFDALDANKALYKKDGAWFFESAKYKDDKDRVVKRADGRPTYLLADIAYHKHKAERGYQKIYDIWGPDHHGYIARMTAAMQAMGITTKPGVSFQVLIVQQVNLLEEGKPVVMSKRLGKFQTMRDLIEKIPVDVCRYFFNMRSQNTPLDFDLELALTQSNQNPVYYIQYAHARIYSIFREASFDKEKQTALYDLDKLKSEWLLLAKRGILLNFLLRFPEVLKEISENLEIHRLSAYLYDVASLFTNFYHEKENRILDKQKENIQEAQLLLSLCALTADVISFGLDILGINAPEKM